MSNAPEPAYGNNHAPPRKIIVAPSMGGHGPSFNKFLVVWACSTAINVGLVLFALVIFSAIGAVSSAAADVQAEPPNNEVADQTKEYDLTNTDLGDDTNLPLAYNVERLAEVSVPGQVDPSAAVGVVNAPESAPVNVPPPPGTGGGTGGALLDPNMSGTGSASGTLGGMGGLYNLGGFGGRSGATRERLLREGGGNARSEKAVADGLKFLALHQAAGGYWSLHEFHKHARTAPLPGGKVVGDNSQPMTTRRNDTAGTAFGLLPFLAAGITHKPSKTPKQVDYTKAVGKAMDYLINKQSKSGGDKGFYGGDMYSHGLATIAMCEAYGLTSDARIKASAQLGVNYIVSAQDPTGGGWRYSPRTPGDVSVTGWQLMALRSGQMAGLSVPRQSLKKCEAFLNSCEAGNKGGYGYMPGTPETITMTAVAALCRQYLGVNPRNPSLLGSVKRIKTAPPGTSNIYYEYYATQVMHHMGGESWQFWNLGPDGTGKGGIRDSLIARQDDGRSGRPGQIGSFAGHDHVGGRLGATSLCLLSLEVYYRHLPLYRREVGEAKDEK
jgi:hypothetical protein